jgi:hypothetical protein
MNFILFVIKQILFMILLFIVLSSLVFLFPIFIAHAAQFQSGVTINPLPPASTSPPPPPCNPQPCIPGTSPTNPITNPTTNGTTTPTANPPVATCGLQILSGVPINYGQLNLGQVAGLGYVRSAEQQVTYTNIGNASAHVSVKGGNWIGGTTANPQTFPPEWTHVADKPNVDWQNKMALKSSEISLGQEQLTPGTTGQSYWQLQVPTNPAISGSTDISGSLHQEVTLDLIC